MQVKGLRDALGKKGVSSNYSYEYADKTWVPHIVPGTPHPLSRPVCSSLLIVSYLPRGVGICVRVDGCVGPYQAFQRG